MSQLFGLQHRGDGEFDTFLSLLKGQVIQAAVDHYNEMQQNKKNANGTSANNGLFSTENDNIQMAIGDISNKNNNFAKNEEQNDLRRRNRQILSERFSPEELKTLSGSLEEAEALLQRGSESSVPEKQKGITGDQELADKQEKTLKIWAKEKGCWIENTTSVLSKQYGKPFASEGEADVYLSNDGKTVVKEISMAYYIEPHLMLDRIVLHNTISPNTPLNLTHFGRTK